MLSKVKSALKAENAAVFKAVVKEVVKTKRQEEMAAVNAAAAATAREEAAAAAQPRAGLLGLGGRFL